MGKKVRSARGEIVDFDLLKVKQEIASGSNVDVSNREAFVEKRLRRRSKRSTTPVAASKVVATEEPVVEPNVDDFEQEAEQVAAEEKAKTPRKVVK